MRAIATRRRRFPAVIASRLAPFVVASMAAMVASLAALLAASFPAGAADPHFVEIMQAGQVVPVVDGVHILQRGPFVVKVAGGAGAMSVFTSTATGAAIVAGDLRSRHVLAPVGTGMAVLPLSLHAQDKPIERYDGLSAAMLDRWGAVLGPDLVGAYGAERAGLDSEPAVVLSGRQYSTVIRRADDAQLLPVFSLGETPIYRAEVGMLSLAIFFDPVPSPGRVPWTRLSGPEVVVLRFAGRIAGNRTPPGDGKPLDCGASGVVRALHDPHWQRLERLLRDGLDPNLKSAKGGSTLLMCALGSGSVQPGAVGALLDAGAAIDARATAGETALHWAVRGAGQRDAARLISIDLLLRRGAGPNIRDAAGDTPLLTAIEADYPEAVALLLAHGADPKQTDAKGEAPVERAVRLARESIVSLLYAAAANAPPP
jgi:hypothetical protein